jgi:ribose transport system permease protein
MIKSPYAGRIGGQYLSAILLLIAVVALAACFAQFRSVENIGNLLVQATPLLVVALGQTLVILTGGLDLSVGVMISLATGLIANTESPVLGVALVIGAAVLLGLINGVGVARFRVHPIIMTLSTATVLQGIVLIILPTPGGGVAPGIVNAVNGSVGPVPLAVAWIVLAVLAAWSVLHRSRLGLHLYAVGGGADNAALAGVDVSWTVIRGYVLCALFAAVAGIFLAGRISSGDPWVGTSYGLDSIAAVALGGTQLTGGIGGVWGTLCGTLLLGLVGNGMNLVQINPFLLSVVNGALLLIAVCLRRRQQLGL